MPIILFILSAGLIIAMFNIPWTLETGIFFVAGGFALLASWLDYAMPDGGDYEGGLPEKAVKDEDLPVFEAGRGEWDHPWKNKTPPKRG